jgi:hypothetical protein
MAETALSAAAWLEKTPTTTAEPTPESTTLLAAYEVPIHRATKYFLE